ncbi:MAG: NAD(P)-binding domain-containing protein [Myxococcales bacterium]|nr:NAD(P)-binding domain-containing protein [Myxococcales bacterium]
MTADAICIIGAGSSGIATCKTFRERGIPFVCFEASDRVGGNWVYENSNGMSACYRGLCINTSKRRMEYPDHPMPDDYPDFPTHWQIAAYFEGYVDRFGFRDAIRFETRVTHVAREGHRWRVETDDGEVGHYRAVVVANGHHWNRRFPDYPGLRDRFAGELIHSKDYRRAADLAGKRVLVIGGGNSACDIAVEAARAAKSAHISLRRGYWFLPKTAFGIPTVELVKPWMPVALQRLVIKALLGVIVGDYRRYGLEPPDHRIFEHHPTINSELLYFLKHGRITPHRDVTRVDGHTVTFAGGDTADVDLIVCATGYHVSFPLLRDGLVGFDERGVAQLVGGMLAPGQKNLFLFGVGQPRYGAGPLITPAAEVLCAMLAAEDGLDPRWLVPTMWLWVNIHGSFPFGPGVLVLLAAGRWIDDRTPPMVELRALAWATLGTALGAIGPLGPKLLVFPLQLLSKREAFEGVAEWEPPSWHRGVELFFAAQLILLVVAIVVRHRRWRAILPTVVFGLAAVTSTRNILQASIVFTPLLAAGLAGLGTLDGTRRPRLIRPVFQATALLVVLAAVFGLAGPNTAMAPYPEDAARWMRQHGELGLDDRVVTHDYVGNWLEYRYGPDEVRTYFDDRVDMYPIEVIQQYTALNKKRGGDTREYDRILSDVGATAVLWTRDSDLGRYVSRSDRWRVVFEDEKWVVALPAGSE